MLDGQGRLRITDFGLAGVAGEVKDIRSGTRGYMAPEQQSGQEVTARSDIYALGVVLHEVFTGKRPSADSSHPDLAPEVDRVIRRCLAQDPAKRPASALQVPPHCREATRCRCAGRGGNAIARNGRGRGGHR
jgi:serine/threonine protein kinase